MIEVRKARLEDWVMIDQLGQEVLGYEIDQAFSQSRLAVLSKPANQLFVAFVSGGASWLHSSSGLYVTYAIPYKNILGLAVFEHFQRQCGPSVDRSGRRLRTRR